MLLKSSLHPVMIFSRLSLSWSSLPFCKGSSRGSLKKFEMLLATPNPSTMFKSSYHLVTPYGDSIPTSTEAWKNACMNMLREIEKDGKIHKHYKRSCPHRCCSLMTCTTCVFTCCCPCFIWDTLCCSLSICCKNPFKYGASFDYIEESINFTFEQNLPKIHRADIDHHITIEVFKAYLEAFDAYIASKSPKKANLCRATLVYLIRTFSPDPRYSLLTDDGDINNLRTIVASLETSQE